MNILQYSKEVYQTAYDKGFWDEGQSRDKGEMVMLMITELSEAVEAHRKEKSFKDVEHKDYETWKGLYLKIFTKMDKPLGDKYIWNEWFENFVKDTVEDEIADAAIRLLDYLEGWHIPVSVGVYLTKSTGNFASDVLNLVSFFSKSYYKEGLNTYPNWGITLAALFKFCEWYEIDLEQHIQWKMRYNATRPIRHGKKY